MNHAITVNDVLHIAEIGLGIAAVFGLGVFLIYVLNPFSSGH